MQQEIQPGHGWEGWVKRHEGTEGQLRGCKKSWGGGRAVRTEELPGDVRKRGRSGAEGWQCG